MIIFELIILFFIGVTMIMICFMMINLTVKKTKAGKFKKLKNMADVLIRTAIFSEDTEEDKIIPVTSRTQKMLQNSDFRKILTEELLLAKKNISGTAGISLENLYNQLKLEKYALNRLKSRFWHIKAKAIQEIGIMGQKEYINKIYRYANNENDLVRTEAQTTIVKLYGFEGLRFLDVVSYQLSEWQQIKLLQELSQLSPDNFSGIEKWLFSANLSVIVFALKLVRNYHRFELYDQVIDLINHPNDLVRYEVIRTLEKIYTSDTSKILIDRFYHENPKNQMALVKAIQEVGFFDDIPDLINFLETSDAELQRAIVRTIANVSPEGMEQLEKHPKALEYPLDQIINQIKGEQK